jgi:hypothetical protein
MESKMVEWFKWNDSPTEVLENQQTDLDIIKNGKHVHGQMCYAQTLKQAPYTDPMTDEYAALVEWWLTGKMKAA